MIRYCTAVAIVIFCSTARADEIPSSGGELGPGDRVVLSVDIPGFIDVDEGTKSYFGPAGSVLWIDTKLDDHQMISVHFACVSKPKTKTHIWCSSSKDPKAEYGALPEFAKLKDEEKPHPVDIRTEYKIPAKALKEHSVSSVGSQYGALIVPYKFHLSDRSFSSGATVGGYYSYAFSSPGISWGPVVSAGLGVVPVTTVTNGEAKTENKAAVSAATGLLLTFSKTTNFQVGILAGWDWLGNDSSYKYEGKTWVALSFGVPLTK